MTELFFLRHGQRIDHALRLDPTAKPVLGNSLPYDPLLSLAGAEQMRQCAQAIGSLSTAFDIQQSTMARKNVFIHFSPFLRCCQLADILVTELKQIFAAAYPAYKLRFQLLGDFALSEWIHDKMRNKPPFVDSNDAYNMYTPNIKLLVNRLACSIFRPTITLGPYNGPDLSFKDYLDRCKDYFTKLLATYEKPVHFSGRDIVIVVSHGYLVNNFLLYFMNHPIFEEMPEAVPNMAVKVLKSEIDRTDIDTDDEDDAEYTWKLVKDCLGMVSPDRPLPLNLKSDIVYYKTNFIKKDELEELEHTLKLKVPHVEQARPSFKITKSYTGKPSTTPLAPRSTPGVYPICPAAKDWSPQKRHEYTIKTEFKLKVMNDELFKKAFDLHNYPSHPVSPEVLPTSRPTRSNLVIDLAKLTSNDDIFRPMRLKYLTALEIPIHKLNSKVNSQVSLAHLNRHVASNNSSGSDLSRHASLKSGRRRSTSNPTKLTSGYSASAQNLLTGLGHAFMSNSLVDEKLDEDQDHNEDHNRSQNENQDDEEDEGSENGKLDDSITDFDGIGLTKSRKKSTRAQRFHKLPLSNVSQVPYKSGMLKLALESVEKVPHKFSGLNRAQSLNYKDSRLSHGPAILGFNPNHRSDRPRQVGTEESPLQTTRKPVLGSKLIFYQLGGQDDSASGFSDSSSSDEGGSSEDQPQDKDLYFWFGRNQ